MNQENFTEGMVMGRTRARRVEFRVGLLSFCSSSTKLGLAVLALSCCHPRTGTAVDERKPTPLDDVSLRYMPDDCRMIARVDIDLLLESDLGRQLAPPVRTAPYFPPLTMGLEQIDRIIVGARALSEGEECHGIYILFCKQPIEQLKLGAPWVGEQLEQHTLWTKPGEPTQAFCIVENRIALTGVAKAIRAVLRRNGPAELPQALKDACNQLNEDAGATFASLVTADAVPEASFGDLLSDRVDTINMEVDFRSDLALRVSASCPDEVAAQQLNGMGLAALALVENQSPGQIDSRIRQVIQSLKCRVDGSDLIADVAVPAELLTVVNSLTSKPAVWSTSGNTSRFFNPNPATSKGAVVVPSYTANTKSVPATYPPPGPVRPAVSHAAPSGVAPPAPSSSPYVTRPPGYGGSNSATIPSPPPWDPYAPSGGPYARPPTTGPWCSTPSGPLPVIELSDIIRLSEAGVDEEIIGMHLCKHRLDHALTTDELILLTEGGVSTRLIKAMMDFADEPRPVPPEAHPSRPMSVPATDMPGVIR